MDSSLGRQAFTDRVRSLCREMDEDGIHVAADLSWRCGSTSSYKEQFEEADRLMYRDKEAFYRNPGNGRNLSPRLAHHHAQNGNGS